MKGILAVLLTLCLVGCGAEPAAPAPKAAAQDAQRLMEAVEQLHRADAQATLGAAVAMSCSYCHGRNGDNQSDYYPSLAGLPADYLQAQLHAYRDGRRRSLAMESLALALSAEEIAQVSAHFGSQRAELPNVFVADAAKAAAGRVKAAACMACHDSGEGSDPAAPPLAGQGYTYLVKQISAYRDGRRQDQAGVMAAATAVLSDQGISEVAQFYASQSRTR